MRFLPLLLLFSIHICQAQDLALVKLSRNDLEQKVKYHYRWESTEGHVAVIDLLLFRNTSYEYAISSNVFSAHSTGFWELTGNRVVLNSDIQNGSLPIQISYRQRDTSDFNVREITFVRNQINEPLPYAFVLVNNDSIKCLYGDLLCTGNYSKIDSVKVLLENGLSSKWIPISTHEGLIQITVLTQRNLENYLIFDNRKYRLYNRKLKLISD